MGPNVLCVVFDTARRDAFEPYGAPPGSTPAVAQLASSGQAFTDVYATASWTIPSHASMFTGSLPRALGLGQAPGSRREGCRPILEANRDRVLPEVLRRNGYATAAVSANVWIAPESGFATGFDRFEEVATGRQGLMHRDDARGTAGAPRHDRVGRRLRTARGASCGPPAPRSRPSVAWPGRSSA